MLKMKMKTHTGSMEFMYVPRDAVHPGMIYRGLTGSKNEICKHFIDFMLERKEKKDCAFWHPFNEKPSVILDCPGFMLDKDRCVSCNWIDRHRRSSMREFGGGSSAFKSQNCSVCSTIAGCKLLPFHHYAILLTFVDMSVTIQYCSLL
jgi:hypothetical protein